MEKLLFTATETATLLGVSKWKVYEILRSRDLDSVRIGGCLRVPKVAIDRYIESLRVTEGAA